MPAETDGDDVHSRRLWLACAMVVVGSLLVVAALVVLHRAAFEVPRGDIATLELRVMHALAGKQFLGPYSRFGTSHPGPAFFYIVAPLYAAMGRSGAALYLGAAAINAASLGGMTAVCLRYVREPRHRAILLSGIAILLLSLAPQHRSLAVVTPWNPYVTVLPFALLLFLTSAIAVGRLRLLPLAVLVHAFVCQSHALYLLPASAALGVGLALGWRGTKGHRRGPLLLGLVAALAWTPPIVEQIWGDGNLGRVVSVALGEEKLGLPMTEVITAVSTQLAGSVLVFVACVVGLVVVLVRGRGQGRSFFRALGIIALVQVAAAIAVTSRFDRAHPYLLAWLGAVALVLWTSLAAGLATKRVSLRPRWALPLATAVLCLVAGSRTVWTVHARLSKLHATAARRDAPLLALHDSVRRDLAASPAWITASPDAWSIFAAVLVQQARVGAVPVLDARWKNMFGPGFEYARTAAEILKLDRNASTAWVVRTGNVPLRVIDAVGLVGDPELAIDGVAPKDGTRPSKANAFYFADAHASVTFHTSAAQLESLSLTAIGDPRFVLEGSLDGVHFVPIAVINRSNRGLRTRDTPLHWDEVRGPEFIRLRPHSGSGRFWVAELSAAARREIVRVDL